MILRAPFDRKCNAKKVIDLVVFTTALPHSLVNLLHKFTRDKLTVSKVESTNHRLDHFCSNENDIVTKATSVR